MIDIYNPEKSRFFPEKGEASLDHKVNVYCETDKLHDLVIWGEPGCETILGQLLPEKVSLFWKEFDVLEGRREFSSMQQMFENRGINVIRMKDVIANNPETNPDLPSTIEELSSLIKNRGKDFCKLYTNNPQYPTYKGNLKVLNWVDQVLTEDVRQYGEKNAIALNWKLCLSEGLPISNIMYARDQSNALGEKIVMSRMRWPIRQPEVPLFRKGYELLGYKDKLLNLSDGYVEGGDAYIFDNTCLIGAGVRTSRKAIGEIYQGLKDDFKSRNIEMFAVVNQELIDSNPESAGDEMDAMHLDTFMMPIDSNSVLLCEDEMKKRHVERVYSKNGVVEFKKVNNLETFLSSRGIRIVDINSDEQKLYSTNFLHIGNKEIIVPLEDEQHNNVNQKLRKNGLRVQAANIKALVGGYGAVHCMTAAIKRG